MRLIDVDDLKRVFTMRVPGGAAVLVKILKEVRTITVLDEAPALIEEFNRRLNKGLINLAVDLKEF